MTPQLRPVAAAFTPAERDELIRVVETLGSTDDGERANAAQIATNLLAGHGLTWADALGAALSGAPAASEPLTATASDFEEPEADDDPQAWRAEAESCQKKSRKLNAWERRFLKDILARRWPLTPKQQGVLKNIGEKACGAKT